MDKEEQTGTEQTGGADQTTGNNDGTTDVQKAASQDAAGNQEVEGLKAAAVAERTKRQAAEAESQGLRDQMALQVQTQQPQQTTQERASLYKAVAKQLGFDPELATPDEQGEIFAGMLQVTSSQQAEQTFVLSHSDFAEVVGVESGPGGQFQYAPPMIRALKANPALANALQNSPNKAVLAYEIASKDPQYLTEIAQRAKTPDVIKAEEVVAKIKAANAQLSISATQTGSGTLDNAAQINAMSNEEFEKHNQAIMDKAL